MRRLLLFVATSALPACPREHIPEPQPVAGEVDATPSTPRFTGTLPPFTDALGKSPRIAPASPGSYAGALRMTKAALPTMEILVDESADGRATLTLADEGTASGCFVSRWNYRRSESHFSTKSGKDETTTDKRRTFAGARGTWTRGDGGWLDVRFDEVARDTCVPPAAGEKLYGAFWLHCLRIEPSDAVPAPLLACTSGPLDWPVRDLVVPLAREKPEDWLVLGDASTGLAVDCDFGRRMGLSPPAPVPEPKITFEKKPVTLTPSEWLKE